MGSCAIAGTFYLRVNGQQVSARGAFDIQPLNFERSADANQDGTIYITQKPTPATAEGTLSYSRDLDLQTLYTLCDVPVTIELCNGDTFVFAKAHVVGQPKLNTEKGEISNFKIASNACRKVNGS
ncbi:phage tail tube family protein [Burkholderia sp. MSHR3999]|uniref:phage tail tube protein n=1 Tax=Burkholderia sp. MSHR3999 TaxID=1542965 RepID=UPI0005AD107C|nr:phage tail tube protein [Burkholderia sp. MSHR3999]KIP14917.1 phage tail tube family protein [Burkholderia sp. MSHR3999]